jgi:hypothetical protein
VAPGEERRTKMEPYAKCPRCDRTELPEEIVDGRCRVCREFTERARWEREHRQEYRAAEHFGDQETLNRLDAEWNAIDEEELLT